MDLIAGFKAGLKPTPMLTVAEWSDSNRVLTSEGSAEPGKWRTSKTPYLKQIFEDLSPSSAVRKVVVAKSAQLGFTESGLNTVGCYMDIAPCPIGYVMPTIDMAQSLSKSRLDAMISHCPSLAAKVPAKGKEGGNTILLKEYPGGYVALAGANSAVSLRSRAFRVIVMDEVDAYPKDLDGEGSPVELAEMRTSTFGDRKKIYLLSTPTTEGDSVIQREVELTEMNKYFVPCPDCGGLQDLRFEQLKWEAGRPETAKYECEHCGFMIEERHKPRILSAGVWRATKPENLKPFVRGYHINGLYSPLGWLSWETIADKYEKAQKDRSKYKTFVNTILGETFKEEADAPEWQHLYNRREEYGFNKPPAEVGFLTAGVDIQKDRIELEIVGWAKGRRSYSIDYRVLLGDTASGSVWDELAKVVNEQWERADGVLLPLKMMAVDSGYNTSMVYTFCQRFDSSLVIPIKGRDGQDKILGSPQPVRIGRNGKPLAGLKLYTVASSMLKMELYGWLRMLVGEDGVEPDGYCHFPQYEQRYFQGLTAERIQYRVIKGYRRSEWVKFFERNEPLDCRVYARAAATHLGIDRMKDLDWEHLCSPAQVSVPSKDVSRIGSSQGKYLSKQSGYLSKWRRK